MLNKPVEGFFVDRQLGIFFGDYHEISEQFPNEEALNKRIAKLEELEYEVEPVWAPVSLDVVAHIEDAVTGEEREVRWTMEFGEEDEDDYYDYVRHVTSAEGSRVLWAETTERPHYYLLEASGYQPLITDLYTRYEFGRVPLLAARESPDV